MKESKNQNASVASITINGPVVIANRVINVGGSGNRDVDALCQDMVVGSGVVIESRREIEAPIHSVKVGSACSVRIIQGPDLQCVVSAEDNLIEMVRTEVVEGRLTIGFDGSARFTQPLLVTVVAPGISKIKSTGVGSLSYEGIDQQRLRCTASGTGSVKLGGRVGDLGLRLSGTASIDAVGLLATDLEVQASGVGSISATAKIGADISVSGIAKVTVAGNPAHRSVETSGMAKVKWV